MISEDKINELRDRVKHHTIVNDTAVVVLTAKELDELLDEIEETQEFLDNAEEQGLLHGCNDGSVQHEPSMKRQYRDMLEKICRGASLPMGSDTVNLNPKFLKDALKLLGWEK